MDEQVFQSTENMISLEMSVSSSVDFKKGEMTPPKINKNPEEMAFLHALSPTMLSASGRQPFNSSTTDMAIDIKQETPPEKEKPGTMTMSPKSHYEEQLKAVEYN